MNILELIVVASLIGALASLTLVIVLNLLDRE